MKACCDAHGNAGGNDGANEFPLTTFFRFPSREFACSQNFLANRLEINANSDNMTSIVNKRKGVIRCRVGLCRLRWLDRAGFHWVPSSESMSSGRADKICRFIATSLTTNVMINVMINVMGAASLKRPFCLCKNRKSALCRLTSENSFVSESPHPAGFSGN